MSTTDMHSKERFMWLSFFFLSKNLWQRTGLFALFKIMGLRVRVTTRLILLKKEEEEGKMWYSRWRTYRFIDFTGIVNLFLSSVVALEGKLLSCKCQPTNEPVSQPVGCPSPPSSKYDVYLYYM
uniref:Uncharacterized protein n=1 Tax=Glossina austeni TaxID=7395 RepID=A0A1A9UVJ5_GLOAU